MFAAKHPNPGGNLCYEVRVRFAIRTVFILKMGKVSRLL
jgi:hypothetical protein